MLDSVTSYLCTDGELSFKGIYVTSYPCSDEELCILAIGSDAILLVNFTPLYGVIPSLPLQTIDLVSK